eukprot:CAMPEP_0174238394 /NCGR_PEP_ID=MMETSP0417-20130205/11166_1 /TAXON_ID=242541 /ORGANISM="Mayorella sp, Strain BSH-02190019" /LENGTH=1060 /DNA_ID=CAMNT_0015317225 /DNA_START=34 /DNA_END=3212 /DNA_ORIENTATION=-
MELQETVVVEDLLNPEKQVAAFTALVRFSLADSIQLYAPYVFKIFCSTSACKTTRLLCYHLIPSLQYELEESNPVWDQVLETLSLDMVSEDQDIQVSAIKFVPFLPLPVLLRGIADQSLHVQHVSHENRPVVRRSAVETVSALALGNRPLMIKDPKFIQKCWHLVTLRLFDADEFVCVAAFRALSQLFAIVHGDAPYEQSGVDLDSSSYEILLSVATDMCSRLVSKYRVLLDRFHALDLSVRSVCVSPLVQLALRMAQHDDVDVLQWLVTEPCLMVAEIVDAHFMPLLWVEQPDLVFAVGCGIARLAVAQPESSHWIFSVIRAFIGLLDSPSISSCTCKVVLQRIVAVIGHLEDEQQVLSTISSLLPAIRLVQEPTSRFRFLLELFSKLIPLAVEDCLPADSKRGIRNRTIVDQLFSEDWLSDITSKQLDATNDPFPQDLLAALLSAYLDFASDPKNTLPTDRDIAVRLLAKCAACVMWTDQQEPHAVELFLVLLDTTLNYILVEKKASTQMQTQFSSWVIGTMLLRLYYKVPSDRTACALYLIFVRYADHIPNQKGLPTKLFGRIENRFFGGLGESVPVSAGPAANTSSTPAAALSGPVDAATTSFESGALSESTLNWLLMLLELLGKLHLSARPAVVNLLRNLPKLVPDHTTALQEAAALLAGLEELKEELVALPPHKERLLRVCLATRVTTPRSASAPNLLAEFFVHIQHFLNVSRLPGSTSLFLKKKLATSPLFRSGMQSGLQFLEHQRDSQEATLLSGASDAILVEAKHFYNPTCSRVTFIIRLTNVTSLPLQHIRVLVGYRGALECAISFPSLCNVKEIPELGFKESIEWAVPFVIHGLDRNEIVVQVIFADCTTSPLKKSLDSPSLHCAPYQLPFFAFLFPVPFSIEEFAYTWEAAPQAIRVDMLLNKSSSVEVAKGLDALQSLFTLRELHRVTKTFFQFAYAGLSWFGDQVQIVLRAALVDSKWVLQAHLRFSRPLPNRVQYTIRRWLLMRLEGIPLLSGGVPDEESTEHCAGVAKVISSPEISSALQQLTSSMDPLCLKSSTAAPGWTLET